MRERVQSPASAAFRASDWTAQRAGRLIWWIIPTLVGIAASSFRLSLVSIAFVWAGAFAWMGTGCALNALRCGRMHCFFSGPALWLGAIGAALIGSRVIAGDLNYVLWGTVALVAASYLPEVVWGKYARTRPARP